MNQIIKVVSIIILVAVVIILLINDALKEKFEDPNPDKLKINLHVDEDSDVFEFLKRIVMHIKKDEASDCPVYLPKSFVRSACPGCVR